MQDTDLFLSLAEIAGVFVGKVGAATTAQLVWILAPRLPEPDDRAQTDE